MESVVIGNQVWSTSNFDGIVAGDGTVIPEVQGATTDGNAELVTNGNFEAGLFATLLNGIGGATAAYTLNTSSPITGTQDGRLVVSVAGTSSARPVIKPFEASPSVTVGKAYRLQFDYKLNSGTCIFTGYNKGASAVVLTDAITGAGTKIIWFVCNGVTENIGNIVFDGRNVFDLQIDNYSIKEVGASDSTLVYNYIYAATTGTAAVKDLAATKAAAMWCHYDNLAANGAMYGKLYNWYAVHLFDLYPPVKGWRVPSKLDFDQLVANQGGSTVAGRKLKAKFSLFNNAFSTNESGLSLLPSGNRDGVTGAFVNLNTGGRYLFAEQYDAIRAKYGTAANYDASFSTGGSLDKTYCFAVRLLRNEPSGLNELSYTSGLFTTDITSTPKQIPISFGRITNAIRIKSENALTSVEAKLYNVAGTAVATLITAKTVAAGATMMFPVIADYAGLLQDGSVRVTASGNSGAAVGMEIEVLTHKGVLS